MKGQYRMREKSKPAHERNEWILQAKVRAVFWSLTFILSITGSQFLSDFRSNETIVSPDYLLEFEQLSSAYVFIANITPLGWVAFALVIAFSMFFGMTERAKALKENHSFEIMVKSPPAVFWDEYSSATLESHDLRLKIEQSFGVDDSRSDDLIREIDESVRIILSRIINLVMRWDRANIERNLTYRANIMQVINFSDHACSFDLKEVQDEEDRLTRFIVEPLSGHYSGVVVLKDNSLTTTSKVPNNQPDSSIRPLVLPYTFATEIGKTYFHTNLRGAPYAVATGESDYVEKVSDIIDHYESKSDTLSKRILNNLKEYYSVDNSPAHSIFSIPILNVQNTQPKWVLNVYRNQSKMLYNEEMNKMFEKIITDLALNISALLEIRQLLSEVQDE